MRAEVPGERVEVNLAAERLGALVAEDGVAVAAVRHEVVHERRGSSPPSRRTAPPPNVTEPATMRGVVVAFHW